MLEIKVTLLSHSGLSELALCISAGWKIEKLAATSKPTSRWNCQQAYEDSLREQWSVQRHYKNYTHSSKLSSTVELGQRDVSNQLNEKMTRPTPVLFPFYVTYGVGFWPRAVASIVLAESCEESQRSWSAYGGNSIAPSITKRVATKSELYYLTLVALQPQQRGRDNGTLDYCTTKRPAAASCYQPPANLPPPPTRQEV